MMHSSKYVLLIIILCLVSWATVSHRFITKSYYCGWISFEMLCTDSVQLTLLIFRHFLLHHPNFDIFFLVWNISRATGWIPVKFSKAKLLITAAVITLQHNTSRAADRCPWLLLFLSSLFHLIKSPVNSPESPTWNDAEHHIQSCLHAQHMVNS